MERGFGYGGHVLLGFCTLLRLYFMIFLRYLEIENYAFMSIELKPETEQLVREEIRNGHFQSIDELIVQGVRALREKTSAQATGNELETAADAVASLRMARIGVTLGGLKIKDLAHEGHRF